MKHSKTALLSLLLLVASGFAETGFTLEDLYKDCDQIVDKQIYTVCYDYKNKGARYVSYSLDGDLVHKNNIKKRQRFYSEPQIPKKYASKYADYSRSGYDRGHLLSDGSADHDIKALRKTYSMVNVVPMAQQVNRETWIKAEKLERLIATKLKKLEVLNGVEYESEPKRIGKNQIAIPKAFWKMLYNKEAGYQKCFYYENTNEIDVTKDKLKDHEINCSVLLAK